jgi:hypothetical protein
VDDGRGVAIGFGDVLGVGPAAGEEVGVGLEDASDGDAGAELVPGPRGPEMLLKDEFVEPPLRLCITRTKPPPPQSSTTTAMASRSF